MQPNDPFSGQQVTDWQEYAWNCILAMGLGGKPPGRPIWGSQLALTELSIPNPQVLNWFAKWNNSAHYPNAVKPFNRFVHVSLIEGKIRREEKITLVSPLGAEHVKNVWFTNIHDPNGKSYRVTARKSTYPDSETLFGQTYDDLISLHGLSKESKFVNSSGDRVTGKTRGLLARQPIQVTKILHVGKEANEFDLVQAGLVSEEEEVLTEYRRDLWEEIKPIVANMAVEKVMLFFGCKKRMAYAIKNGERRPSKEVIFRILKERSNLASLLD